MCIGSEPGNVQVDCWDTTMYLGASRLACELCLTCLYGVGSAPAALFECSLFGTEFA